MADKWETQFSEHKSDQSGQGSSFGGNLKYFAIDFLRGQKTITTAYCENILKNVANILPEKCQGKLHQ